MRVDAFQNVAGNGSHLQREHALRDHLAGAAAHDADAQHPFALRVDEHLRQAVRDVECHRPAAGAPRELQHFVRHVLLLRVDFREADPGDLGIGEDHGRDTARLPLGRFAEDRFDADAGFGGRLVRQPRFPGHIADGVDVRHRRATLAIDGDEAAFVGLQPRFF